MMRFNFIWSLFTGVMIVAFGLWHTGNPKAALSSPQWKTFVSANFQIAVDYPSDWSVNERETGVTFSSVQRENILLAPVETGSLSSEDFLMENQLPNTRCSSKTNPYGVTIRVCFDTISRNYTGYFVLKTSPGSKRLLSLTTSRRADLQVFNQMIDSLRPLS